VIGRGKKWLSRRGNEKLRDLVTSKLDEYSAATSKNEKSKILSYIVTQIRTVCPEKRGSFVKYDVEAERWFDVGDFLARERVSQAFRDALHNSYRSSNEYKKKRKREQNFKASLSRKFLRADTSDNKFDPLSQQISSQQLSSKYNDFSKMFDLEVTSSLETMNLASGLAYSLPASYCLVQWFEDETDKHGDYAGEDAKMTSTENFDFIHTLNDCISGMGSRALRDIEIDRSEAIKMEHKKSLSSKDYSCDTVTSSFQGFNNLPVRNISSARTA